MELLGDTHIISPERGLSDESILEASLARPELFRIIVQKYQDAFLRKARRIVRTEEDAEDVVQEAFTKIYVAAPRFKKQEGATFSSWAYQILVNTALTKYQKLKRERGARVDLEPEVMELVGGAEAPEFEQNALKEEILLGFSKIPRHFAKVLSDHFLEDRPQKDIAAAEGVAVGVIKTRVLRAKRALKKAISK